MIVDCQSILHRRATMTYALSYENIRSTRSTASSLNDEAFSITPTLNSRMRFFLRIFLEIRHEDNAFREMRSECGRNARAIPDVARRHENTVFSLFQRRTERSVQDQPIIQSQSIAGMKSERRLASFRSNFIPSRKFLHNRHLYNRT